MINRRKFLGRSAAIAAAGFVAPDSLFIPDRLLPKLGIQLFSLPKMLDQDFGAALKMLARIGYKELELYGPYPFSTKKAQDSWNAVTPSLGFKGSGYFGHTPGEVKALLNQLGMTAPSAHTDLDTLETAMDKLGEASQVIGNKYVVLPAIPQDRRQTLDDYKKMADLFNKIGAGI